MILRCKDTATAHSWFVAIHTNIMALLPQVLAELNAMLGATSTAGGSKEVKHIAWLAEQVGWEAGQSLTWLPFRARMLPPFHIYHVFRSQISSLQIFCLSSPPFRYLLLIITFVGRIDCHDNYHHSITKMMFLLPSLFLMTEDHFHDFRIDQQTVSAKGQRVSQLPDSAIIARK